MACFAVIIRISLSKQNIMLYHTYPLYVSDTPAKGSFPHLANKNTVFNPRATIQVKIMNLIMFLQSNWNLETKVPLMTWPIAAPGINTSPEGKQGTNSDQTIKEKIKSHYIHNVNRKHNSIF